MGDRRRQFGDWPQKRGTDGISIYPGNQSGILFVSIGKVLLFKDEHDCEQILSNRVRL